VRWTAASNGGRRRQGSQDGQPILDATRALDIALIDQQMTRHPAPTLATNAVVVGARPEIVPFFKERWSWWIVGATAIFVIGLSSFS